MGAKYLCLHPQTWAAFKLDQRSFFLKEILNIHTYIIMCLDPIHSAFLPHPTPNLPLQTSHVCLFCLCICIYVPGACRGQNKALDLLELELLMAVCHHVGAGN